MNVPALSVPVEPLPLATRSGPSATWASGSPLPLVAECEPGCCRSPGPAPARVYAPRRGKTSTRFEGGPSADSAIPQNALLHSSQSRRVDSALCRFRRKMVWRAGLESAQARYLPVLHRAYITPSLTERNGTIRGPATGVPRTFRSWQGRNALDPAPKSPLPKRGLSRRPLYLPP